MIVLNISVFICMFFIQVTTKNFPGGALLVHIPGMRTFGRSLMHNDYQTLAAMTSKFLQVGIVFDGSGQNIQIFRRVPVIFIFTCFPAQPDCMHFLPEHCNMIIKQQLCGLCSKLMLFH